MSDRTPPGVPDRAGGRGNRLVIGCGIALVLIVAVVAGCTAIVLSNSKGHDSNNEYEATRYCESEIKDLLKSPSSAEFDSVATGGGPWTVTGTVDAENDFGAMIRSEFQCTVTITGDSASVRVDRLD